MRWALGNLTCGRRFEANLDTCLKLCQEIGSRREYENYRAIYEELILKKN
ncbi:MAG: hypothetical protein R2865_15920 [Deinococcales bacterium]